MAAQQPVDPNWQPLSNQVHGCRLTECPRHQSQLPVLFERIQESLTRIRYVVVTEEPSYTLLGETSVGSNATSQKVEASLANQCLSGSGVLPRGIAALFGRFFDPTSDAIYWSHLLKCIPRGGADQITGDWTECIRHCQVYFVSEIDTIPSEQLMIITLGKHPAALCRRLLFNQQSPEGNWLEPYIRTYNPRWTKFRSKDILFLPFLHPTKRYRGAMMRMQRQAFIHLILQFQEEGSWKPY